MGEIWKKEFSNVSELIKELKKHRHWCKINDDVLKDIFNQLYDNNDNVPKISDLGTDNMQQIRDFLIVSEEYKLVENNFLKLARTEEQSILLSFFAVTFERLGASIAQGYPYKHLDDKEFKQLMGLAELSYQSSILCDKFFLTSYYGVVFCCCAFMDLERAKTWEEKFNDVVKSLNSANDSQLNYLQITFKKDKKTIAEIARMIDKLIEKM